MRLIAYENPHDIYDILKEEKLLGGINLTVSQTLLNGILGQYSKEDKIKFGNNIYTIEKFMKEIYDFWLDNLDLDISLNSNVSKFINRIKDPDIHNTFYENKSQIVQSLKKMYELSLNRNSFSHDVLNNDLYNIYFDLMDYIYENVFKYNFKISEKKVKENFDKNNLKKRKQKIIIHSVHQFTPSITRLINELKKINYEIIFMINYNKNYEEIYKTWRKIYSDFVPFKNWDYKKSRSLIHHSAISKNIANYLSGNINKMQEIKDEKIAIYNSIAEMTDEVDKEFKKGKMRVSEDDENVLKYMNKQYYAINGVSSNKILKLIYPKQFKKRHFLAYPVGKFILALYNNWDEEKGDLLITREFKDLLTYDIWNENPMKIYRKLEKYIGKNIYLAEMIKNIKKMLKYRNEILVKEFKNKRKFKRKISSKMAIEYFNQISFHNASRKELRSFILILEDIQKMTKKFFIDLESQDLKEHLNKVVSTINNKKNIKGKVEDKLLNEFNKEVNQLNSEHFLASIDDIKDSLHILYNDDTSQKEKANWIIRDIEQLDGEVLYKNSSNKMVHIGQLSEDALKKKCQDKNIWPLYKLINSIHNVNVHTKIYKKSHDEYYNFMIFMIYYASYYMRNKKIEYSYILDPKSESTIPLDIIKNVGLNDENNKALITSIENTFKEEKQNKTYCLLKNKFRGIIQDFSNNDFYFIDQIQQKKFLSNLYFLLVIDDLINDFFYSKSSIKSSNYYKDKQSNYCDKWEKNFRKLFFKWPNTKIDEILRHGKKNLVYSFDFFKKFIKGDIKEKRYINSHNNYRDKQLINLMYNESYNKNDNLINYYKYTNRNNCKNCMYKTICNISQIQY